MRIVIASAVLSFAGCGGGLACKDAVGKAAHRFGTEGRSEVATLIGTCEQDAWSASVRSCFAGAATADALEACLPAPPYEGVMPTVEPSAATKQLVGKAGEPPIKALVFFDHDAAVGAIVRTYFEHLGVTVERHERYADAKLAQRYLVDRDGAIVVVRGDRSFTLHVDPDPGRAITTGALARLDHQVARRLGPLVLPTPRAYLVAGHGEITDPASRAKPVAGPMPERHTTALRQLLTASGFEVAPLSPAQLARQVPGDASVVLWLGPAVEPSAAEWSALGRYLDHGGHLVVALDPGSAVGLGPLEAKLGVRFVRDHLADDQMFLAQRHTVADHGFVLTDQFASHASVAVLARSRNKAMLWVDPGRLERLPAPATGLTLTSTIRTRDTTFVDRDHDYTFDAGEHRGTYDLAFAIERGELRAAVFADVDLFADALVNAGGAARVTLVSGPLLGDTLRWLRGDDDLLDPEASSDDAPAHARAPDRAALAAIEHRRKARALARALAGRTAR